MVAKVRTILAVRKYAAQMFDRERFNIRKLNELEVREHYKTEITNRFATMGNLSYRGDINKSLENIKENIRISAKETPDLYELKQHKTWFDEGLGFLDQGKLAEMLWLQDPNQRDVDNLNNVRRKASRHFRNKKKAI